MTPCAILKKCFGIKLIGQLEFNLLKDFYSFFFSFSEDRVAFNAIFHIL